MGGGDGDWFGHVVELALGVDGVGAGMVRGVEFSGLSGWDEEMWLDCVLDGWVIYSEGETVEVKPRSHLDMA